MIINGQNLLLFLGLLTMLVAAFKPDLWTPIVKNWLALSLAFVIASWLFVASGTLTPK